MKWYFTILITLITFTFCLSQGYQLSQKSAIVINGKTNVSDFQCKLDEIDLPERVGVSFDKGYIKFSRAISLPIDKFKCGNPLMTIDFREILNSKNNPFIELTFNPIAYNNRKGVNSGKGKIEIAGVENTYNFNINLFETPKNLSVEGTKMLKMTDFKIEPPEKMFGLVKTNDILIIDFQFLLEDSDHPLLEESTP